MLVVGSVLVVLGGCRCHRLKISQRVNTSHPPSPPPPHPPPQSFQIKNRAMDYPIGDRVEVLWEQKLYTAEVRAVYTNGKVDVVYDADASVGYLLSVAEHGLNKMWMPKKKGKGGGECKGLLGCWMLQHRSSKSSLRKPQHEAMLGGRLHHQSTCERLVRQTRSIRQVCYNGVRNQRSEEGRPLLRTRRR